MAKEKLFEVVMEGDETEWAARAGVNEDDDGVPQPWTAPAVGRILVRASDEGQARRIAVELHPEYHSVLSAKALK